MKRDYLTFSKSAKPL